MDIVIKGPLLQKSLALLFLSIIMVSILVQVSAYDSGTGDAEDEDCIGCHAIGGSGAVELGVQNTTGEGGRPFNVTVTVNLDSCSSDAKMSGVMILTGSEKLLQTDGWTILADPNMNDKPGNYNEKSGISGNTELVWTLEAPLSEGNYTLKARLIYDDDGAYFLETDELTVSISEAQDLPEDSGDEESHGILDRPLDEKALSLGLLVGIIGVMLIWILRR